MLVIDNQKAFSARFKHAMRRKGFGAMGATELAEALASVFPEGVSVQTTHKWINGTAVPRADRLAVLAAWLDVSQHWLAHGPDPRAPKSTSVEVAERPVTVRALARRLHALSESQRRAIEMLIAEFEKTPE